MVVTDFEAYCRDSKSASHHSTVAKEMILQHVKLCYKAREPLEHEVCFDKTLEKAQNSDDTQSSSTLVYIEDPGVFPAEPYPAPAVAENTSTTEDSDVLTSVTSLTDGSDNELSSNQTTETSCKKGLHVAGPFSVTYKQTPESSHALSASHISTFNLALLLVSTLENITCSGSCATKDPALLMHTSGQLINILSTLKDPRETCAGGLCAWSTAALVTIQLIILRTVFAILFTACTNPKSSKQLSNSSYIVKMLELMECSLEKEFLTKEQHNELVKLLAAMERHPSAEDRQKLSTVDLWLTFQHELFLGCSLQGILVFVTACLNHGTSVNSSLLILCHELFEQFSSNCGFEFVSLVLLKADEALLKEPCNSSQGENLEKDSVLCAYKIEHYTTNLASEIVRNLGKMISLLKRGKSQCKSSPELSNKRSVARLVSQGEEYVMCDVYPQSSEVEESSESAADMEFENERQRQFSGKVEIVFFFFGGNCTRLPRSSPID